MSGDGQRLETSPSPAAWRDVLRGKYAVYTLILNLGIGLHAVDVFVVSTIMPAVVREIGGAAFYAWPTMLYMVASIIGAACGGPVRAALGSRKGYVAAAGAFLAGSAGCGLAFDMPSLLAARFVQGLGGGLIIALSMVLVRELYDVALRTRVLSTISTTWGVAALAGPMIGGLFAEVGWWRGAFLFAVPVVIAFALAAWRALPSGTRVDARLRDIPFRRLALLGAGVLSLASAGNVAGTGARVALVLAALALVLGAFRLDARAAVRLFPSRALSLGTAVGTANWMFFLYSFTHSPLGVFTPLVAQVLHGASPLVAGYINAMMAVAWTVAALVTASLRGRAVRIAVGLGPIFLTIAVAGQAWFAVSGPFLAFVVSVTAMGLGIGASHVHVVTATMAAARAGEEAVTTASISTIRTLGVAFGAAFAGLVANAAGGLDEGVSPATVAAAATWIYWIMVLAPATIAVLAFRLLARHRAEAVPGPLAGGGS